MLNGCHRYWPFFEFPLGIPPNKSSVYFYTWRIWHPYLDSGSRKNRKNKKLVANHRYPSYIYAGSVEGSLLTAILLAIAEAPWENRAGALMSCILKGSERTTVSNFAHYLSAMKVRESASAKYITCQINLYFAIGQNYRVRLIHIEQTNRVWGWRKNLK